MKISDTHAFVIGDRACYLLNLDNGSNKKLKEANWTSHLAHVEYNGNVISVTKGEIYEICSQDGTWKTIQKAKWPKTKAMCRIGRFAYVAYNTGIFQLDLENGCKYKKINDSHWSSTKAMVVWNDHIYCFCDMGLYRVNQ